MLSAIESERYHRQILLPEIGTAGQERLKQSKVVIVGAGGLGSPAAIYLAVAGIGTLTIIDHDRVQLSNLNRQILHGDSDIDKLKADSAKEHLNQLNSTVDIKTCTIKITTDNAAKLIEGSDVVIDALDNLETRYILNRAAVELCIPLIHGAVNGFEGRALTIIPGRSTCLRCMHASQAPVVATFPVIGVTPAVIGAIQATEAMKLLLDIGDPLFDRLLVYDGLKLTWTEFKVRMNPECEHCGHMQRKDIP